TVSRWRQLRAAGIGVVAGAALAAGVAWLVAIRTPHVAEQPARFGLVPPAAQRLAIQGTDHDLAISPDGSHIVYRAGPGPSAQAQMVVRALNDLEARPIAGTNGARNPFISPDGRWVGFFAAGELRQVSITGGPAISLCKVDGAPRGARWGDG